MKILIAEDERSIRVTLADHLEDGGHDVKTAENGSEALAQIDAEPFDVVISDVRMPGVSGTELLRLVKERTPHTEVIIMTGVHSYELAIECIKAGAYDFIPKPFKFEEMDNRLAKLADVISMRRELSSLRNERDRGHRFENIVGTSPRMQRIFDEIRTVADSDIPILLHGESGTGKELFAKAVHANSPRANKPFITVALHARNENLIESDLFGHVRGGFTGADTDRDGAFVKADGGTLFLDDIDDMPINAQAKLLRAVQFGEIEPLGWKKPALLKVDVRIVAATKVDLQQLIEDDAFREDLYYRINSCTIDIPPLRERFDDIPHLVTHFIEKYGTGKKVEIADDAMLAVRQYHWPGNIRELEQAMRLAIVKAGAAGQTGLIRKEHFTFRPRAGKDSTGGTDDMSGQPILKLGDAVAACEKSHIQRVLRHTSNNTVEAAQLLGISRKNLWEKRKKYEIDI